SPPGWRWVNDQSAVSPLAPRACPLLGRRGWAVVPPAAPHFRRSVMTTAHACVRGLLVAALLPWTPRWGRCGAPCSPRFADRLPERVAEHDPRSLRLLDDSPRSPCCQCITG